MGLRARTVAAALFCCVAALLCRASAGVAQQVCSSQQTPAEIDARIDRMIASMTVPERISQLQDRAPSIPRIGLPGYNWWNEGLHGLARDGYATVFPQAIGLAATWDPALLHDVGVTVSTEARAHSNQRAGQDAERYGGLTIWSPNVNIFRDPRWGRGQETYGEDPFLTSTLATGFVQGLQGDDPFYRRADATPKHFAAHSGPERGRDSFNAVVSPHDLADTYLRAFHILTTKADAAAVMCSYNEINGVPSCASRANLQGLVRERWGFHGYVVSDCGAVGNIAGYHHYAVDNVHGAADALNAGVDLECGSSYAALQKSIDQHLVTEDTLNRSLHRLLLARVRLGMFDSSSCSPYSALKESPASMAQHRALALHAAEESIVLLRNDGVLPLRAVTQAVAVIGPTADMLKVLEANYHGTARRPVTPLDGMRAEFAHTSYAQGSLLAEGVPAPVPRSALRADSGADAAAGLHAQYFNTASLDGPPVAETTVEKIDFDTNRVGFVPAQTSTEYSARWSGYLAPPAAGIYTLRVDVERCWDCTTHDTFKLYVDGALVLDNHGATEDADRVNLQFPDTKPHTLRLEYRHTGKDEGVALEWVPPASALLDEAEKTALAADVVVAFVGLSPDLEGEALQVKLAGFSGGDRTSLDLPEAQRALLHRLQTAGKPLVVVLTSGSAVVPGVLSDALLEAWYPGEAGGEAVSHVLSGKVNPSGRLPVTFYRSAADLPPFGDYSMTHRTYRYFSGPVLFPFGFGLSYSHFTYGTVQTRQPDASDPATFYASARVRNGSSVSGEEVVELYVQPPRFDGAPRLSLQGVQRIRLQPGESREILFRVTARELSTVDFAGTRWVRTGTYRLYIGGAQPDPAGPDAGVSVHIAQSLRMAD